MARVVRRAASADSGSLELDLMEYREHKTMVSQIQARLDTVKSRLNARLERAGEPDAKGSLWIALEYPLAGYGTVKRERRAKVLLDERRAEEVLKRSKRWEECTDVHVVLDGTTWPRFLGLLKELELDAEIVSYDERISDDKIMQTYFAEQNSESPAITSDDIDEMFREEISWALIVRDA